MKSPYRSNADYWQTQQQLANRRRDSAAAASFGTSAREALKMDGLRYGEWDEERQVYLPVLLHEKEDLVLVWNNHRFFMPRQDPLTTAKERGARATLAMLACELLGSNLDGNMNWLRLLVGYLDGVNDGIKKEQEAK